VAASSCSSPKTGSKLWRYAYLFDTKQKLLAIGQYPLVSLADARTKRDNAKRLLADGVDPSVERKAERRQARIARSNIFEWPMNSWTSSRQSATQRLSGTE
jgi:hypothetical protein